VNAAVSKETGGSAASLDTELIQENGREEKERSLSGSRGQHARVGTAKDSSRGALLAQGAT
jgi:hypothetical protein